MEDILSEAKKLKSQLLLWRRHIHENAETGDHLPHTAAYVESVLDGLSIPHERISDSGIVGVLGKGKRSVLIRADMDALPGHENSGLPFACKTGAMHACGHDIHTASLLGAAELLKRRESSLKGRCILLFQPGEETMTGALDMIQHGVLEKYTPELALAMHVNVGEVPAGDVWIKEGAFNASSDIFEVRVIGKGGHGAYPEAANNPIYPTLRIIEAYTQISRFEIPSLEPNVLTVCSIEAGNTGNVIPTECVFRGSLRTFNQSVRDKIIQRLEETAVSISGVCHCTAEFKLLGCTPPLANDPALVRWAEAQLSELLGKSHVKTPALRSMGSEDFAHFAVRVPACYISVGIPCVPGCNVSLHNENIVFDEEHIPIGAAAFAQLAYKYLQ